MLDNAKSFAKDLQKLDFEVVTGGTSNHIISISLRKFGIHGGLYEHLLNSINVSCNKNTLKGDLSALKPSGIRLGSPAMTTRGCREKDFKVIAEFLRRAVTITQKYNTFEKLIEFKKKIN